MNFSKYWYTFLICLSIALAIIPQATSSINPDTCKYHPDAYQGLEMSKLSHELNENGLIGRIHGAVAESKMYLISVREPENFFSHREFSLIAEDNSNSDLLNQAKRHDLVCIQGKILPNPSPQKHIKLDSIKILETWKQSENFSDYERKIADLPEQLTQQTSLIGKVHAISNQGKILVMGYQDSVIPIFVDQPKYTQSLYRGDIVELNYKIQPYPQQPSHLQLDTTLAQPITVIDAIANWHNQPKTLSGSLVKFPQSPQLKFDVFAMEVETKGIKRYFTLINFEDMNEFTAIRQKLAKIWDENADTAQSGRNKLINLEVKIQAKGITNIISPEQANPQILLDSVDNIEQLDS